MRYLFVAVEDTSCLLLNALLLTHVLSFFLFVLLFISDVDDSSGLWLGLGELVFLFSVSCMMRRSAKRWPIAEKKLW